MLKRTRVEISGRKFVERSPKKLDIAMEFLSIGGRDRCFSKRCNYQPDLDVPGGHAVLKSKETLETKMGQFGCDLRLPKANLQ